ncbi:MAG: hypothetical protein RCG15_03225 [Candidatus Rickettsia vulgarisii]
MLRNYLVNKGADVNIKYQDGDTLLLALARSGDHDRVEFLIQNGADLSVVNNYGESIFSYYTTEKQSRNGGVFNTTWS